MCKLVNLLKWRKSSFNKGTYWRLFSFMKSSRHFTEKHTPKYSRRTKLTNSLIGVYSGSMCTIPRGTELGYQL
jgi:hypothetical protein